MNNYLFSQPIECVIRAENQLQALQILDDNNVDYTKNLEYDEITSENVYFWIDDEESDESFFEYLLRLLDLNEPRLLIVGGKKIW